MPYQNIRSKVLTWRLWIRSTEPSILQSQSPEMSDQGGRSEHRRSNSTPNSSSISSRGPQSSATSSVPPRADEWDVRFAILDWKTSERPSNKQQELSPNRKSSNTLSMRVFHFLVGRRPEASCGREIKGLTGSVWTVLPLQCRRISDPWCFKPCSSE